VFTHWEAISEDLKKRDERLQAVEDAGRQLLRLQDDAHKAELRNLIDHVRDVVGNTIQEIKEHNERVGEFKQRVEEMFDEFMDTIEALALILYIEQDPTVQGMILDHVPPKAREMLNLLMKRIREMLESDRTQRQSLQSGDAGG